MRASAYSFSLGSLRSNEASPIVIGNTLYVSTGDQIDQGRLAGAVGPDEERNGAILQRHAQDRDGPGERAGLGGLDFSCKQKGRVDRLPALCHVSRLIDGSIVCRREVSGSGTGTLAGSDHPSG